MQTVLRRLRLFLLFAAAPLCWGVDGQVNKSPSESFNVSLDFKAEASSVTLTSCTATDLRKHEDSTSSVIASYPAPAVVASTKVVIRVKGGASGENHMISVKVTSATGETFEGSILLHIL